MGSRFEASDLCQSRQGGNSDGGGISKEQSRLNGIGNLKVSPDGIRTLRTILAEYHGPDMIGLVTVTKPLTLGATLVGE